MVPNEMHQFDLRLSQHERPAGMETEVFACGRLPLAYPDGMMLATRETQTLFVLNVISTQSANIHTLIDEVGVMKETGVDIVRISPQEQHTEELVSLFYRVIRAPSGSRVRLQLHWRRKPKQRLTPAA